MANQLGKIVTLTTFGESHGEAIGGIVDGFPADVEVDLAFIQAEMDRRKPGQSSIVTQRKENDCIKILSGIFEGKSTGSPIGFRIENSNSKPKDYGHLANTFRPSHADFTYTQKYGLRDYRGGGRSSARETANWVVAGALAKLALKSLGVKIFAHVTQVGHLKLDAGNDLDFSEIEKNPVRCANKAMAIQMENYIKLIRSEGDTVGGVVECVVQNPPINLGEPVFDKLHAALGHAMLSINAAKGFDYGSGFTGVAMRGTEHNDEFTLKNKVIGTKTNYSGGIQGGISNGENINFRVAFKPVATIMQNQNSIDSKGKEVVLKGKGRHDPCVVPRAVPIVEALTAFVLLDFYLLNKTCKM